MPGRDAEAMNGEERHFPQFNTVRVIIGDRIVKMRASTGIGSRCGSYRKADVPDPLPKCCGLCHCWTEDPDVGEGWGRCGCAKTQAEPASMQCGPWRVAAVGLETRGDAKCAEFRRAKKK